MLDVQQVDGTPYSYLGAEFPKVLEQADVEYKQANLTIACKPVYLFDKTLVQMLCSATVASVFDPPDGKAAYSYVYDFSGETRRDRAETVCTQLYRK